MYIYIYIYTGEGHLIQRKDYQASRRILGLKLESKPSSLSIMPGSRKHTSDASLADTWEVCHTTSCRRIGSKTTQHPMHYAMHCHRPCTMPCNMPCNMPCHAMHHFMRYTMQHVVQHTCGWTWNPTDDSALRGAAAGRFAEWWACVRSSLCMDMRHSHVSRHMCGCMCRRVRRYVCDGHARVPVCGTCTCPAEAPCRGLAEKCQKKWCTRPVTMAVR